MHFNCDIMTVWYHHDHMRFSHIRNRLLSVFSIACFYATTSRNSIKVQWSKSYMWNLYVWPISVRCISLWMLKLTILDTRKFLQFLLFLLFHSTTNSFSEWTLSKELITTFTTFILHIIFSPFFVASFYAVPFSFIRKKCYQLYF